MKVNDGKPLSPEERKKLRIRHTKEVKIPQKWKPFLWSYQEVAPLEKIIVAVCQYGKFEDIKELYKMYPKEMSETVLRRPDIHRGIKFWINKWNKNEDTKG